MNQGKKNKYIRNVFFNGEILNRNYIAHEELMRGGELRFEMMDKLPDKFSSNTNAPTLTNVDENFVPLPYFINENRVFDEKLTVTMDIPDWREKSKFKIEVKTAANDDWKEYEAYVINADVTIWARTINIETKQTSEVVKADFVKKNNNISLELISKYANQYNAGGDNALIDGISGGNEYRTGDWQGYYGEDINGILYIDDAKMKLGLKIGLLEDLKSWIYYPQSIEIAVSFDGKKFEKTKTFKLEKSPQDYRPSESKQYSVDLEETKPIKAIRFSIKNPGVLPNWHLGAGNPSWIFVDEIKLLTK